MIETLARSGERKGGIIQRIRLCHNLLKGHESLASGHTPCTAPQSGILVQPEQALL